MPAISDHIRSLKILLTNLKPTGEDGFEGLIANALCKITGFPFRLAASGRQSGSDGSSAARDRHISFECKRYSGPVREAEVMAKIGELAAHHSPPDVWVLCATSPISQQIAGKVKQFDRGSTVSTLVLDWPDTLLPPLATALAMAKEVVAVFINKNVDESAMTREAMCALNTIARMPEIASQADILRRILTSPEVGLESARYACNKWLEGAFSSKNRAMYCFGQPLSPADCVDGNSYERSSFICDIGEFLTGCLSRSILFITGDEGVGKSWIVAQSWLYEKARPIMLVISPNVFPHTADELDIESTLSTALITQTEARSDRRGLNAKWCKTFDMWRQTDPATTRLVVVIDGINQRSEKDWGRILDRFSGFLHAIGGQLIVTVRKSYYRSRLVQRLASPYNNIEIPEWTDKERDAILKGQNITAPCLAPKLMSALRNPRILGIAIKMWTRTDISSLADLSVSRLLLEHIRTSERDAPSPQPYHDIIA